MFHWQSFVGSRKLQLTLQLTVGIVLAALFVLVRPLHVPHACLVSVFVILIIGALSFDQHIGTRLQVSALLLGPAWLAALLAGCLMSLAKLASPHDPNQQQQHQQPTDAALAATCVAAVAGLTLLVVLKGVAPMGQPTLLAVLSITLYGIHIILCALYSSVAAMWAGAIGLVAAALAIGAGIALLVGLLVAPSLASDEVLRLTAEALQAVGGILSFHASLLLSDDVVNDATSTAPAAAPPPAPPPPRQPAVRRSSIEAAAAGAAVVAASEAAHRHAAEAAAASLLSWAETGGATLARSSCSTVASDAAAEAFAHIVPSQQQQHANGGGGALAADSGQQQQQPEGAQDHQSQWPPLSEQLLQQLEVPQAAAAAPGAVTTQAWVAAAAACSRQASLSLVSDDDGSTAAAATAQRRQEQQQLLLSGAASLQFAEEMDDAAFLAAIRAVSHEKSIAAAPAPAAHGRPGAANSSGARMQQSKSAASGLSALSVAGLLPDAGHTAGGAAAGATSSEQPELESAFAAVGSHHHLAPAGSVASAAPSLHALRQSSRSRALLSAAHGLQQEGSSTAFRRLQSLGFGSLLVRPPAARRTAGGSSSGDEQPVPPPERQQQEDEAEPACISHQLQPAPGTSAQLQPLVGRAKVALAAARLEPHWLRPRGLVPFDAAAFGVLLNDVELLLVRVSTLEGISEERRLMALRLHALPHYHGIADALGLILAQLGAFTAQLQLLLQAQDASRHAPAAWGRPRLWPPSAWFKHSSRPGSSSSSSRRCSAAANGKGPQHKQPPSEAQLTQQMRAAAAPDPAPAPAGQQQQQLSTWGGSAFAAAGCEATCAAGPDGDTASMGVSTLLSALERQGSLASTPHLWRPGLSGARDLLRREIDAGIGQYWWSVRNASKALPVRVPRSREVMTLHFLWPVCNGLLEACERVEASATAALQPAAVLQQQQQQQPQQQPQQGSSGPGGLLVACLARQRAWAAPLMELLLVQSPLRALRAAAQRMPSYFGSRAGVSRLLASRVFQANIKFLAASSAALVATLVLMARVPEVAAVAPIFGFTAVALSFQSRIEATLNKVAWRVLGTVLGALLGLATVSVPGAFEQPLVMLACVAAGTLLLGLIARSQARIAVVLAVITLCAVSLCSYEAACCAPPGSAARLGAVDVFVARLASVVGGCVFVMAFNRLVLPWSTSQFAYEQLADALEDAVALMQRIYASQYERMRLSERVTELTAAPAQRGEAAAAATTTAPAAAAAQQTGEEAAGAVPSAAAAAEQTLEQLAACEAAEAQLGAALRAGVLGRLVDVQLLLARDSVSWRRGVLSTPPLLLNVLGAMDAVKEALASQRLALAPFTTRPAAASQQPPPQQQPQLGSGRGGMLHTMRHCYSLWAKPLDPVWQQVLSAVDELARTTAAVMRRPPRTADAREAARVQLRGKLRALEAQRLDLRHAWLELRVQLHKRVAHSGGRDDGGGLFWPTDSVHLFTQTQGVSRCLNAFAAVSEALADGL